MSVNLDQSSRFPIAGHDALSPTPQTSSLTSPQGFPTSGYFSDERTFYSTRLDDRSRTPSPELKPQDYYPSADTLRNRDYGSQHGIRRMPSLPVKILSEPPSVLLLSDHDLHSRLNNNFPRLARSPSQPASYYPESPYESDNTTYDEFIGYPPARTTVFRGDSTTPPPSVSSRVPPMAQHYLDPLGRNFNLPGIYHSQQPRYLPSTEFVNTNQNRFFNDPFEDRPPAPMDTTPPDGFISTRWPPTNDNSQLRASVHPTIIRAQPGNIPLSDSEQEDWC